MLRTDKHTRVRSAVNGLAVALLAAASLGVWGLWASGVAGTDAAAAASQGQSLQDAAFADEGAGRAVEYEVVIHGPDGQSWVMVLNRDDTLTVETEKGFNTVTVENGRVFMADADCGNGDCMRQGSLDGPGGQIVCLPHSLWIEVVTAGSIGPQKGFDTLSR